MAAFEAQDLLKYDKAPEVWHADVNFLRDHAGFDSNARQIDLPQESIPLPLRPFDHRHETYRNMLRPDRINLSNTAYSLLPEPAQLPWEAAIPSGLMMFGAASYVGGRFLRKSNNKYAHRAGVVLQGTGLAEFSMGTVACVSPQAAETAPVAIEIQRESIASVLQPWEGHDFGGYIFPELVKGMQYTDYITDPLLSSRTTAQVNLDGAYTFAGIHTLNEGKQPQHEAFLITLDANGVATQANHLRFPVQPSEALGLSTNAELFDINNNKKADIYFNATPLDGSGVFATIKFLEPTPVPTMDTPVSYIELFFPSGATQEQKQNFIDELMSLTLTGEVQAAGQVVVATSTEMSTAIPTEAPVQAPFLDATKSFGEWDLSAFSAEQQIKINQAMNDPDHTPIEVKNEVDQILVDSIRQLTGDNSYAIDADPMVNSAYVGRYAEYLFNNGIHEVGPLPFAWRKDSLGTLDNFPVWNDKGRPGYLIEGFEWMGHDPNYGTPNALWNSVEWDSTRTGVGENKSIFTPESEAEFQLSRIEIGHNADRDTIFGDPFLITYPSDAMARGDLMLLTPIAGTNPDTAQEAVIRMFGYDGLPRYAIIRIQYGEESIAEGDKSCMKLPSHTSEICPPGTELKISILSSWEDLRRENSITASRSKMLELMGLSGFTHPLRITLQAPVYSDHGYSHSNLFMDGALLAWDIKTPTVPPEFFK